MHNLRSVIIAVVLSFLVMGASFAQESYYVKGKMLVSYCQETLKMVKDEKYDVSKSSWCLGFVQASVMSHQLFSALMTLKTPGHENLSEKEFMQKVIKNQVYCVSNEVTLGQIVSDVVTFLEANPKYQNDYASIGIVYALHKMYPCKLEGRIHASFGRNKNTSPAFTKESYSFPSIRNNTLIDDAS